MLRKTYQQRKFLSLILKPTFRQHDYIYQLRREKKIAHDWIFFNKIIFYKYICNSGNFSVENFMYEGFSMLSSLPHIRWIPEKYIILRCVCSLVFIWEGEMPFGIVGYCSKWFSLKNVGVLYQLLGFDSRLGHISLYWQCTFK